MRALAVIWFCIRHPIMAWKTAVFLFVTAVLIMLVGKKSPVPGIVKDHADKFDRVLKAAGEKE